MYSIYALFLISMVPFFANAQNNDTVNRQIDIEEVVITGQFKPTSLRNSIYKIRSIDKKTILRRGTADMSTLLNTQLGIRFNNDLTLGESDIQIMGVSGQNVKILLDGVPLIDRGSTKQSLSQIDVNIIERIEIVEGPISVMYGTDALAGVVNIITNQASLNKNKWGLTARILEETVSSEYNLIRKEGRHNAHVGVNYKFNKWKFDWSGSKNDFGGYQGKNTGRTLEWQPKDQWHTTGRVGYNGEDFQTNYTISYANENIYTPGAIEANYKYIDKNYITDRLTQTLQSQLKISDQFHLSTSLAYQHYQRRTKTQLFDLQTQGHQLTTNQGEQDLSRFNQVFVRVNGIYRFNKSLSVLTGVELDQDKGSGARIDVGARVYNMAGFLATEYQPFVWLMIRPGVRFIYNSTYDAPPAIPSINAKFVLGQQWDLRMGYARGFRAPALRELYFTFHDSNHAIEGNKDLKAEYNNNYNTSLSYNTKWSENSFFRSSIGAFFNQFNNLITTGLLTEDSNVSTYINVGKFKTTGGTWENSFHYYNWNLDLGFSYTGRYNDMYIENKSLGKFFWTPEINAMVSRDFPQWGANINVFYKLYGERPSYRVSGSGDRMEINQAHQQAYNQLDISIGKELFGSLVLQAGVRNLTNTMNVWNTASEGTGAHEVNNSSIPISYGRSAFLGILYQIK
ncbi:TonB-dependent receptor [Sphingobacterium shayense]|uniref:TonB-dependent receptor plug domain-containing protein n=1 Tax=Sphingobacterium shayense TaxID=626343 RepID=UPI001554C7D2|nr:TonB-dependent receptor [Sphingobacterium shayense]NQD69925.1 TonB-dependent receptor [Sphingobacterium shayense]